MQTLTHPKMSKYESRTRSIDMSPGRAKLVRIANCFKRALEEGVMPWNPKAKYRNVFLLGGITHVPHHEFPDHIDFFMAMANMLRFRYKLNTQFALLDNEVSLHMLPKELRAHACYALDQTCTQLADFIVAELSVPSTGTGQELERARQAGVPVIALAKMEIRKEVTPSVFYEGITLNGERQLHEVQRGISNISLMVEGNPALVSFFTYSNNGHVGRTDALINLNKQVSELFGLRPASVEILKILATVSEFELHMRRGMVGRRALARFVESERFRLVSQKLAIEADCDPMFTDEMRMTMVRTLVNLQNSLDRAELARTREDQYKLLREPIAHRIRVSKAQLRALDELLRFPHDHSTFYYQRMFPENCRLPLADVMKGNIVQEMVEVRAIRDDATLKQLQEIHAQRASRRG